jgi:Holliday junction resolvasome RuvABC endonuclease subunit
MGIVGKLKEKTQSSGRFLAIDSSSKSLAFSIFDKNDKTMLISAGKIDFPADMAQRLKTINIAIESIFDRYGPIDHVVIEQTIYIQSPQTSRILSYVVGHIWGKCLEKSPDVRDVEVMKWKSYIGYKNVSKAEKLAWEKEFGITEAKKIAAKERKERTGKIIKQKIKGIDDISDYDIIDAVAIGIWAVNNV